MGPRLDHDQPGLGVHPALEAARLEGADHRDFRAGGQDVLVGLGEPADDGHHLLRRLAQAEDGLRDAMAERAMQVHAREAKVLDGQIAQPCHGLLGREGSRRDRFQQLSYFFAIHFKASLALPLLNPCRSRVT